MDDLICLNHSEECDGPIEFRMPLSATGRSFPRCEKHWEERLEKHEEDMKKDLEYRRVDYMDAGERYEEDY